MRSHWKPLSGSNVIPSLLQFDAIHLGGFQAMVAMHIATVHIAWPNLTSAQDPCPFFVEPGVRSTSTIPWNSAPNQGEFAQKRWLVYDACAKRPGGLYKPAWPL